MERLDRQFLRKADLVETLGLARSTVSDWIDEFAAFIPTIKHGNVKYYGPQAIDVLQSIKGLREEGLAKPEIIDRLKEQGFAITIHEETVAEQPKTHQNAVSVIGLMRELVASQAAQLQNHEQRLDASDGRVTGIQRELDEVRQQLAVSAETNTALMSALSAPWWQRRRKLRELAGKLSRSQTTDE